MLARGITTGSPACQRVRSSVACNRSTHRRVPLIRAQGETGGSLEDLFQKEIKRRGMSLESIEVDEESLKPTKVTPKDPFSKAGSQSASQSSTSSTGSTRVQSKPPSIELEGQRERSIAMVTEGLEGLPGRASELLKLGGTFFLAFTPSIAVFGVLFAAIYLTFGSSFVHGGVEHSMPPHYDVERLLSEPTVDPYIGF